MRSLGRRTSVRTQSELAQTELSVPRWAQELRSAGPPEGPSPDPTTTTNKPPTDGWAGPGPGRAGVRGQATLSVLGAH